MNFWRHRKYEPWLVPYAEGTLDGRRRAELEAQMARDPVLASEAEAQRQITRRLREARQAEPEDAEASRLWLQIEARLQPQRRSVAPLAWASGACAAACLAWAAISGPFSESSLPSVGPRPPVAVNAPMGAQVASAPLARPKYRARPTRPVPHVAERPVRPAPVVVTTNPADQQADESRPAAAPTVVVETAPPTPKAAVAVPGAARFQTAEGVHEKAPDMIGEAPISAGQNDAEMKVAEPVAHDFSPDSSAQTALSVTTPAPAVTPQAAPTPTIKRRHHRHHRRAHRQSGASLPATPAPKATDTPPTGNTSPLHPMPGKPVD